jgi:Raf kinase inhibitor-like YbhB/YbcL family protein
MTRRSRASTPGAVAALAVAAALLSVFAAGAQQGAPVMEMTSTAFKPGGTIPARHTCDGEDLSPALAWTGVPEGTKSLALIMDDPDAPPGTWVHWVLYDLPAPTRGLPEGVAKQERLKDGSTHGACWGVDRFSRVGYYGPCPPPGKPHHYNFRLFALDTRLDLPPKKTVTDLDQAMKGHILAQATLTGLYGR